MPTKLILNLMRFSLCNACFLTSSFFFFVILWKPFLVGHGNVSFFLKPPAKEEVICSKVFTGLAKGRFLKKKSCEARQQRLKYLLEKEKKWKTHKYGQKHFFVFLFWTPNLGRGGTEDLESRKAKSKEKGYDPRKKELAKKNPKLDQPNVNFVTLISILFVNFEILHASRN